MQYEHTVILKNKTECLLRNGTPADAEEIRDLFNQTHGETDFLLTYPDENSFSVEDEERFLERKEKSPNEIEICAVVNGKIAGTAGIDSLGLKEKVRHRAEFGISIAKECWGNGIGRALTMACIQCAKRAGYQQLELVVVAENTSAVALYKSVGFTEFGRNPKGFRSRNSGWQELIHMRLELE